MVLIIGGGGGWMGGITKGSLDKDNVPQVQEGTDLLLLSDPMPAPDHLWVLVKLVHQLLLSHEAFPDPPPSELKTSSSVLQARYLCPFHGTHFVSSSAKVAMCLFPNEAILLKAGAASYSLLYPPVALFLTQSRQVFKNVSLY